MADSDIAPFFAQFNLNKQQLERIAHEIEQRNTWWDETDIDWDWVEAIALIAAPGKLSQLSAANFHLLKRCRGRVGAFFFEGRETNMGQTRADYAGRFRKLANLGLIVEADITHKLKGSRTIAELQELLSQQGLATKGNKDILLARLIDHLSATELRVLVADVVLYATTAAGDEAIKTIDDLCTAVLVPLREALLAYRVYVEAQPPLVPEHVPPEFAEIYTEGEWQAIRGLPDQPKELPEDFGQAPRYIHPGGSGLPAPGWDQVSTKQMTRDQRRAIFADGLVAVSNLKAPGFVSFSDDAEEENYVQFTEAICEASSHNQPGMKPLSAARHQALLGLGFQTPVGSGDNFWMDYSTRSLDEMVSVIESVFVILGSSPDFALVVEFDDGKCRIPVDTEGHGSARDIATDDEIGFHKMSEEPDYSLPFKDGGQYTVFDLETASPSDIQEHKSRSDPLPSIENPIATRIASKIEAGPWVTRGGKEVRVDAVAAAWPSGNLARMLNVLDVPTHPIDRHYLLQSVVAVAYAERNRDPEMRSLCEKIAWMHLAEFPTLSKALVEDFGERVDGSFLVGVTTFRFLAIVLTENGEFDKAVGVCELAMKYRLDDGTRGGWEKRIERIRKKQHEKT